MKKLTSQHGFTIVELLLALVFFSSLLVFATASYIRINRSYVRGVNVKLVQEETRKVIDELSSALKGAGSGTPIIIDEDNMAVCDPRSSTDVNVAGGGDTGPTSSAAYEYRCRHRLCVGDKVYAWNQSVLTDDIDEYSWYQFGASWYKFDERNDPLGDPFSIVKTTRDGGTNIDCAENIEYLESVAMVDNERIMVQDIDIYLVNVALADTYSIRVSLSTIDNNSGDNTDVMYPASGIPSDSQTVGNEFKGTGCHTNNGSQEFCFVETLSTIVTIR